MFGRDGVAVCGALLGLAVPCSPAHAADYVFSTIAVPGAGITRPADINDAGQVVGSDDRPGSSEGFIWTAGQFAYFSAPAAGSAGTIGVGIDTQGEAVGQASTAGSRPKPRVVIDRAGSIAVRGFAGTTGLYVAAISRHGLIVGSIASGTDGGKGFLFKGGQMTLVEAAPAGKTSIAAVNANGDLTGRYFPGAGKPVSQAYVDVGGQFSFFTPRNAVNTAPLFIGDDGVVAGTYSSSVRAAPHGFVRDAAGSLTIVDVPGAGGTEVIAVGPHGEVYGNYSLSVGGTFVQRGFSLVGGIYRDILPPGATSATLVRLNARSALAGVAVVGGATVGFVATCPGQAWSCTQ